MILHPVEFTNLLILTQRHVKSRYILVATFLDCQLVDIYATIDLKVIIFEFHQLTSLDSIVFRPVGSVLVAGHEYLINLWQISKAGIVVSGKPYTGLTEKLYACSVNIVGVLDKNIRQYKMVASPNLIRLVRCRRVVMCCSVRIREIQLKRLVMPTLDSQVPSSSSLILYDSLDIKLPSTAIAVLHAQLHRAASIGKGSSQVKAEVLQGDMEVRLCVTLAKDTIVCDNIGRIYLVKTCIRAVMENVVLSHSLDTWMHVLQTIIVTFLSEMHVTFLDTKFNTIRTLNPRSQPFLRKCENVITRNDKRWNLGIAVIGSVPDIETCLVHQLLILNLDVFALHNIVKGILWKAWQHKAVDSHIVGQSF